MIVNLLANDVGRFDFVATNLHFFWIVPIQSIVIAYLMWREIQIASLAGVLSMAALTLPVQGKTIHALVFVVFFFFSFFFTL